MSETTTGLEMHVDDHVGADTPHFLRDVSDPATYTFAGRHDGAIRTDIVDGRVCHVVVETFAADADGDSLSWSVYPTCPEHDTDHLSKTRERDADAGETRRRFTCDGDDGDCPFALTMCEVATQAEADDDLPGYGDPDYERPLWMRATIPHSWADEQIDTEDYRDILASGDSDDDPAAVANAVRRLTPPLGRFQETIRDAAYVSPDDGADHIERFDCARCGDTHDLGADRHHPGFDDPVCRACEDEPRWTLADASLPDAATDALAAHEALTRATLRALLRDLLFHPAYIASGSDDRGVADVPACPTGRGGHRGVEQGEGRPGTGLRRPDGALHGEKHWRAILTTARDAGLIERVDDEDVAFDHQNARWVATSVGERTFDALAHCRWCGKGLAAHRHEYTVQLSRFSTTTNNALVLVCPDQCRTDLRGSTYSLERPQQRVPAEPC